MTSGETAAIRVLLNRMMPVAIAVDLGALGRRRMFGAGLLLFVVAEASCALELLVG